MKVTKHDIIIDKLRYELDKMSDMLRVLKKEWHGKGKYNSVLRLYCVFFSIRDLLDSLDDLSEDYNELGEISI